MMVDPRQVLRDARGAVLRGAHAEALEKYLWFHYHALDHDPYLAGARLRYAVFEWIELGKVYPPAREALESIQSSNLRSLQDGSQDPGQFHDFASINERLGRHELTNELFARLAESEPEFASRCFLSALVALIRTRNFSLARRFVPSPTKQLDTWLACFSKGINGMIDKGADPGHVEIWIGIYAERIRQLSSIFEGVGENEEATFLQMRATEALDPIVQEELRRQLLWR